ncbi:MAG: alanine--tRNA ligase [Campylobacterota bacterium]|nr:alanine--tRNA ligase [Campylobacterota bacterium]
MNIRQDFLDFFENKNHEVISSMPLVPDDATLLFTNAGMVQFKDIFTGSIPIPAIPRATSCQLCIRAGGKHNDLENVGYTARHHTLFEMLGNFSFGDYFKEDAIAHAWEFITVNLNLPKDKLWVTVYDTDDEAFDIWAKIIDPSRIKRFGEKDNFWSMGDTGACGPCSEIFYDQGAEHFSSDEDYLGGEGDRFLEIWNLVFMQYEKDKSGTLNPLPKPSIDTGMGLERVIAIKEGVLNNFDSSQFKPLIQKMQTVCNQEITQSTIGHYRVIADHIRAVSFMLSQGIRFGAEGREYVLRRILRRAVRHGYLLGMRDAYMAQLVDTLLQTMDGHYSELEEQKEYIKEQITLEEQRFFKTIEKGMNLFNEELPNTKGKFSGQIAFKLYDTFGFPLDLTQDMLREKGLEVDSDMFDELMNNQRAQAKASQKFNVDASKEGDFKQILERVGANEFIGYDHTQSKSTIVALLDENYNEVQALESKSTGWVMLDQTPFYAQAGGQVGDVGALEDGAHIAIISNTKKFYGMNFSLVEVVGTCLSVGEKVEAVVVDREEVAKHHSATHFLQSALKMVLGDMVSQAGSLNDGNRLRFDFTAPKAMTQEQIDEVQDLVNSMIAHGIAGDVQELPIEQAKKSGAIAMFGEKYGDVVRVVSFGDVSVEFCGGTHVKDSSSIGSFYITKESGVSAGVRRIEAVCGLSAIKYAQSFMDQVSNAQVEVKNKDILLGITKLKEQIKTLKTELIEVQESGSTPLNETMIGDVKVVVDVVSNGDIKKITDDLKNANDKVAVFLLQVKGDKVMMVSGVKDASIKAGDWIKNVAPIVNGGGGGRPDFAQAGGKDISKINEAKDVAMNFAKEQLS